MNNLAGKLNKKIELWGNVETAEKNSINQNVWQEQKIKNHVGTNTIHRQAAY